MSPRMEFQSLIVTIGAHIARTSYRYVIQYEFEN